MIHSTSVPTTYGAHSGASQVLQFFIVRAFRAAIISFGIIQFSVRAMSEFKRFFLVPFFRVRSVLPFALPLALLFCIFFSLPSSFGNGATGREKVANPPANLKTTSQTTQSPFYVFRNPYKPYDKSRSKQGNRAEQKIGEHKGYLLIGVLLGGYLGFLAKGIYWSILENNSEKSKSKEGK